MTYLGPEQKARKNIDQQLIQAGWIIQNKEEFNRFTNVKEKLEQSELFEAIEEV